MRKKRVLIVDDERSISDLLSVILVGMDLDVTSAMNGMDALTKIRANSPDLVILDVNMPRLDGWEVLRVIRGFEETKDIPVIMCTSKNLVADVEQADHLGATAYITKPFDIERVIRKVTQILSGK